MSLLLDHGWFQCHAVTWLNNFALPHKLGASFIKTRATFGKWSPHPDVMFHRWDFIPREADGTSETVLFISPG